MKRHLLITIEVDGRTCDGCAHLLEFAAAGSYHWHCSLFRVYLPDGYDPSLRAQACLDAERAAKGHLPVDPIPMVLHCPQCGAQHIDAPKPENGWTDPPHKSHLCHSCGTVWRPADVPTSGVAELRTRGKADTWPEAAARGASK